LRLVAIVACGVVVVSVILGITGVVSDGIVRPFAIIALVLAAVALLGAGIVYCQSMVDEMGEDDPYRVTRGGAFGRKIQRALRQFGASLIRAGRELVAALRRSLTRESIARFARSFADTLSGVPPPGVRPPRAAEPRRRSDRTPRTGGSEPATPRPTPQHRRAPARPSIADRRRASRQLSRRRRLPV
jgi:hypothetical protein